MAKPSQKRSVAENEASATLRLLRVSPQKLNLVAQSIRGLSADKALSQLAFSPKRIANDVRKVVQSAVANAEENHDLDVDRLVVAEASVGKSLVMKRFRPRARGRAAKIVKPFSQIRVVVREMPIAQSQGDQDGA